MTAEYLESGGNCDTVAGGSDAWNCTLIAANSGGTEEIGFENYRALAGEVEARNVQARRGMTTEQRRNTLLSETEKIAREEPGPHLFPSEAASKFV